MYSEPLCRGDVYLVQFPLPNPKEKLGNTITKYVLCLQEGQIIADRPLFSCAKLTSIKNPKIPLYPTDVMLSPLESNSELGVIIQCDYVHTVAKAQILKKAYKISEEKMKQVDKLLFFAIGLEKVENYLS